jgi:hypothetical protein
MGGNRDHPEMAPGEAESLKIPADVRHDDEATEDSERLARGLGTGGGAGQSFFDPAHPQPAHDANVHAREGHAEHGDQEADEDKAALSPREREAEGTEDPRERGVGA